MQIILQATHGVVSGAPAFFKRAFGDSTDEFEEILLRPHHFIFNREWYEHLNGKAEFEAFQAEFQRLSISERRELLELLSSVEAKDIISQRKPATQECEISWFSTRLYLSRRRFGSGLSKEA